MSRDLQGTRLLTENSGWCKASASKVRGDYSTSHTVARCTLSEQTRWDILAYREHGLFVQLRSRLV